MQKTRPPLAGSMSGTHCQSCIVLCSHSLEGPEGNCMRVTLNESNGVLHILVQHAYDQGGARVCLRFDSHSTEYIADYYTAFVKTHEAEGYRVTRTFGANLTRLTVPTGRKGDTSIDILSQCFHLPITDASKELGICSTSLKKICRKHGLLRWPHRKVKSVDQKLSKAKSVRCRRGQ